MHHPLTHSCTLLYFLPPSTSDLALNRNCHFGNLTSIISYNLYLLWTRKISSTVTSLQFRTTYELTFPNYTVFMSHRVVTHPLRDSPIIKNSWLLGTYVGGSESDCVIFAGSFVCTCQRGWRSVSVSVISSRVAAQLHHLCPFHVPISKGSQHTYTTLNPIFSFSLTGLIFML